MHVMGLSLTATSAVWVLLDTSSGTILAEEVVPVASVDEVAKAAALSVQAFAEQTEHGIDRVHLTWTPDGRQHGVRLRTKLRLYGFESIETLSPDEAREGRNRTARHIAPHLAMAYGAARAEHTDESGSPLQKLTALVPRPVAEPDGLGVRWSRFVDDARMSLHTATSRVPVRIAGGVAAAAVVGLVAYALVGTTSSISPGPAPAGAVAEPAPSAPEAVRIPAPQPVVAHPDTLAAVQPEVAPMPESVTVAESALEPVTVAESAPVAQSVVEASPVQNWSAPAAIPHIASVSEAASPPAAVTPLAPAEAAPVNAGVPTGQAHLSGPAPVPGPIAVPGPPAPAAPAPAPGPLSGFLGALP